MATWRPAQSPLQCALAQYLIRLFAVFRRNHLSGQAVALNEYVQQTDVPPDTLLVCHAFKLVD
jgi:hypothetical protein